jgi:ComF family protein
VRCGIPLATAGLCGRCQRHPPAFDAAYAPYVFCYPLDRLIHRFKYGRHLELAGVLGYLLRQGISIFPGEIDVVIAVPLSKERLAERGFNQSAELARPLAATIRRRFDPMLCGRKRNTIAQAGLDLAARRRNLRDAFRVDAAVAGLSIAIVDDVVTTGETLSEMAATLKKGGAKRVLAWALCRAVTTNT